MRQLLLLLLLLPSFAAAAGKYFEVAYPPSEKPGELVYGVTYTLWLPDGVENVRGIIVHQHGCGAGACRGGQTAAQDLHWQALAAKHGCALLGTSYHQEDGQDCRKWCDPRNGSEQTFLRSLNDFAKKASHPEIAVAPWALWGHSGGGFWSSIMLTLHPDRIAAIWLRSGSALYLWEKGQIPRPEITAESYRVPICFNGGLKEEDHKAHGPARVGDRAMFAAWRKQGAPAAFARDPQTGHECGDSRYLAIPFLDACLTLRLPESGNTLKPIHTADGWLSEMFSEKSIPASNYKDLPENAAWMPTEALTKARAEYITTGTVTDTTPPPAPTDLSLENGTLRWNAEADLESGIQQFIILRDGKEIGRVPEKPANKFGKPLFQGLTYGDTPEPTETKMSFSDKTPSASVAAYRVVSVNSSGLPSE